MQAFSILKEKLISELIVVALDYDLPFELVRCERFCNRGSTGLEEGENISSHILCK